MAAPTAFPTFEVEGQAFSRLMLGHNPFIGGSYMSQARSRLYQETLNTAAAVERIIVAALKAGARGMMMGVTSPQDQYIMRALQDAVAKTGVEIPTFVIVPLDIAPLADRLRSVNCKVCLLHGQITDALYVKAQNTMKPEFADFAKTCRDLGFLPGMSTHNAGETIPAAEPFDIAVINTPINKLAWRMCPCEEQVLGAIRRTKKKVVGMKPLAMGRLAPQEGMDYVCRLPDLDGIVVGIGHEYEIDETFGIARQIWLQPG
jgi:hypothetical protein